MPARAVDRELLKKVPLFARLGDEPLEALASAATLRRLAPGEELFHKGDRAPQVYVIARGRLAVSSASADGNQVVLNLMDEGEVVGELALLATGRRSASVKAVEPSEVVVLERRDFLGYLREQPDLALELLGLLAERVVRISEFVEDVVLQAAAPGGALRRAGRRDDPHLGELLADRARRAGRDEPREHQQAAGGVEVRRSGADGARRDHAAAPGRARASGRSARDVAASAPAPSSAGTAVSRV
jgi:CRP-like cAMP-binding protein